MFFFSLKQIIHKKNKKPMGDLSFSLTPRTKKKLHFTSMNPTLDLNTKVEVVYHANPSPLIKRVILQLEDYIINLLICYPYQKVLRTIRSWFKKQNPPRDHLPLNTQIQPTPPPNKQNTVYTPHSLCIFT